MGMIGDQFKAEVRQLPFMLGKLAGGVIAVIGFAGAIVAATGKPAASWSEIFAFLGAGVIGICIFALSSRLLKRHLEKNRYLMLSREDHQRINIISWSILIVLVVIFLLSLYAVLITQ
jgi:hypothetical protein